VTRARIATALLASLAAILALPSAADAAGARGRRAAAKLVDEGNRLLEKKQAAAALERYERAYAAYPSPMILFNFGEAQRELGRSSAAAASYQAFLETSHVASGSELDVAAKKQLAKLAAALLRVRLIGDLEGTELMVDGAAIKNPSGGVLWLDPGRHELVARQADRPEPFTRAIDGAAGLVVEIEIAFAPPPPGSEPHASAPIVAAPLSPPPVPAAPAPAAAPAPDLTPDATAVEDEGSVLGSWWLWTLVGAAAASAVGTGVVAASGGGGVSTTTDLGVSSSSEWRPL
jgi:hypothetical protein